MPSGSPPERRHPASPSGNRSPAAQTNPGRPQQGWQPFQLPPTPTYPQGFSDALRSQHPPSTPTYHAFHPTYGGPSAYGTPSVYGNQYTQPMGSHYPSHTYGYPQTSLPAHDPSMPFSPPPIPSPSHVGPSSFQRHPSESGPSSSYGSGAPASPMIPPPSPIPTSPKIPGGPGAPPPQTGYGGSTYYSTPPVSTAPPYSFGMYAQSPTVYQTPFAQSPFGSPYPSLQDGDSQPQPQPGWWYMPHMQTTQAPYQGAMYTGFAPLDPYPPPSPMMPMSPAHRQTRFAPPPRAQPPPDGLLTHMPLASPAVTSPPMSPSVGFGVPSPVSPGASTSEQTGAERPPPTRKPYHPKPPQNRSEWVMWAGNVPADATHDELWRFFAGGTGEGSGGNSGAGTPSGVSSLHLISRSNCAFVNFESEAQLRAAISRFDGVPVRAGDPRCPRLVCRMRRKEDDLKAGVGVMRGTGVHTRWAKQQADAARATAAQADLSSEPQTPSSVTSEGPIGQPRHKSSGSDSYASTNSSLLLQNFPRRYFILKSLTQYDLDLSVEKGLWATQRHNEGILDQAFRTSKEVFLIFGVNKSGEFYGYARMAGPIRGDRRVSWASSSGPDQSPQRSASSKASKGSRVQALADEAAGRDSIKGGQFFSPDRLIEESPLPWSPAQPPLHAGAISAAQTSRMRVHTATDPPMASPLADSNADSATTEVTSAPAHVGRAHTTFARATMEDDYRPERLKPLAAKLAAAPPAHFELTSPEDSQIVEQRKQRAPPPMHRSTGALYQHEPLAPAKQVSAPVASPSVRPGPQLEVPADAQSPSSLDDVMSDSDKQPDDSGVKRMDTLELERRRDQGVAGPSAPPPPSKPDGSSGADLWGGSFQVEWVRTERLPFWRTRHIRNPWNQDREVKVSRDGTELEPSVGQQLLDEWDRADPPQSPTGFRARRGGGGRPEPASAPLVPEVKVFSEP